MSTLDQRPSAGLRKWLELDVELTQLLTIGPGPAGEVRLVPIVGGRFSGEELSGIVLPGGGDWQTVRADGALEISARYLLKTDQEELIEVRSEGLRAATAEVLARLASGELVPPTEYYFRTSIRFRTAAPRLARLNDRLAISYGMRRKSSVGLEVYEVL